MKLVWVFKCVYIGMPINFFFYESQGRKGGGVGGWVGESKLIKGKGKGRI